jgi:hypothetical protein
MDAHRECLLTHGYNKVEYVLYRHGGCQLQTPSHHFESGYRYFEVFAFLDLCTPCIGRPRYQICLMTDIVSRSSALWNCLL